MAFLIYCSDFYYYGISSIRKCESSSSGSSQNDLERVALLKRHFDNRATNNLTRKDFIIIVLGHPQILLHLELGLHEQLENVPSSVVLGKWISGQ